jgi:hypothetical protein
MKLLFLLSLLFSVTAYGQDTINNFRIDNGEVVWQKIYPTKLSAQEVFKHFGDKGLFEKYTSDSLKMSSDLRSFDADYKGAGFSEWGTPIYVARNHFNAYSTVEYREGKYRATVRKIVLTQKYDDGLSKQGEKMSIETYAAKGNSWKSAFIKTPTLILNYTLSKMFNIIEDTKKDW